MKQGLKWGVLATLCIAGAASAQDADFVETPRWSVQSGRTVGSGSTVIHAQLGFPGISATLLHGLAPNVDLGGRFSFNYGFESQAEIIAPGFKLQAVARIGIVNRGRFNFGIRAEPGVYFYFRPSGTWVGLALPVGFDFGIAVSDALMINLNVELPLVAQLNQGSYFAVPVLFCGGAEYKVDRNLALTFNTRFGPYIYTNTGGANFAFNLLFGIAYKF